MALDNKSLDVLRATIQKKPVPLGNIPTGVVSTGLKTAEEQSEKGFGSSLPGRILSTGIDIIQRPLRMIPATIQRTSESIGTGSFEPLKRLPYDIGGIITGTKKDSFVDMWNGFADNLITAPKMEDYANSDDYAKAVRNYEYKKTPFTVLGTLFDISADPLNFIGGGLTQTGRLAQKVMGLSKTGEKILTGSKMASEIKRLGLSDDLLKLGINKAEQAQKGQRAFLSFLEGTRWEVPILKGASIYEKTGDIGNFLKQSKVGELLGKVFKTKTSNEAFNSVKSHFDDLLNFRRSAVMDEAVDIQKQLTGIPENDVVSIIDRLEGKAVSLSDELTKIADRLKTNFEDINKFETNLGIRKSEIKDYFPHIKIKGKPQSIKEQLLSVFSTPKKFSTQLGAAKQRGILNFVDEAGNNYGMGTAKKLGLKPIDKTTGIYQAKNGEVVRAVSPNKISTITEKLGRDFITKTEAQRALKDATIPSFERAMIKKALLKATTPNIKISDIFPQATVRQINEAFGTSFFEARPAIAFAERALASARAVTSKEFFDSVKQFALKKGDDLFEIGMEVKAKELAGFKFEPEIANAIDEYYKKIKPDELNIALKTFDKMQNWWKAQALVWLSYHTRNMAGDMWNNYLAGVINPDSYYKAGNLQMGKMTEFTDDIGRKWNNTTLLDAAKLKGVIDEGWYAKDIEQVVGGELLNTSYNPLKNNFWVFQANKKFGTIRENFGRLAHFIDKLKEGNSIDDAANSVKKYLFDYADLSWTEKNIFKRVMPFYTWTRKNIPLQFEKLLTEPAKISVPFKIKKGIESRTERPDERFLGRYIEDNISLRVGTDKEGNTNYFLMGQWIPSTQAITFLSQPLDNFIASVSPFFKIPAETWFNQSLYFEDTFGQPSEIEKYPGENQSYLGLTMRKKLANVLKNIRVLNELDKLNPGEIFGDKDKGSVLNMIAPEAGFKAPFGMGYITPSEKRGGRYTQEIDQRQRILQSIFGKLVPYNPKYAQKFYLWDVETKKIELQRAIKDALKDGQKNYAERLKIQLKETMQSVKEKVNPTKKKESSLINKNLGRPKQERERYYLDITKAIGDHETDVLFDKNNKPYKPKSIEETYSYQNPFSKAIGRYQIEPDTLESYSRKYLGRLVSAEELRNSPELQDEFVYEGIKDRMSQGLTKEEAIKSWNRGMNGNFSSQEAIDYFKKVSAKFKPLHSQGKVN